MSPVSTKPYLIRAIYEWCVDNGYTPHLVAAVGERTRVPREFAKDGEIILNVGPGATRDLLIDNDSVRFSARFGGVAREIHIPMGDVLAIYARENGEGLSFPREAAQAAPAEPASPEGQGESPAPDDHPPGTPRGKSHLRIVK